MSLTGYMLQHQRDYNPRSPQYSSTQTVRVYDIKHCDTVSYGSLWYLFDSSTEYWENNSNPFYSLPSSILYSGVYYKSYSSFSDSYGTIEFFSAKKCLTYKANLPNVKYASVNEVLEISASKLTTLVTNDSGYYTLLNCIDLKAVSCSCLGYHCYIYPYNGSLPNLAFARDTHILTSRSLTGGSILSELPNLIYTYSVCFDSGVRLPNLIYTYCYNTGYFNYISSAPKLSYINGRNVDLISDTTTISSIYLPNLLSCEGVSFLMDGKLPIILPNLTAVSKCGMFSCYYNSFSLTLPNAYVCKLGYLSDGTITLPKAKKVYANCSNTPINCPNAQSIGLYLDGDSVSATFTQNGGYFWFGNFFRSGVMNIGDNIYFSKENSYSPFNTNINAGSRVAFRYTDFKSGTDWVGSINGLGNEIVLCDYTSKSIITEFFGVKFSSANCPLLMSKSLTTIDGDWFGVCSGIANTTMLTTVNLPSAWMIDFSAFNNCTLLESVNLPQATFIGGNAFNSCTKLSQISLPKALFVGDNAFSGCSALTTVNLPEATYIGDSAFKDCSALTSINLPNVTYLGEYALKGCTALSSISIPKIEYIDTSAIPKNTNIGWYELIDGGERKLSLFNASGKVTLSNMAIVFSSVLCGFSNVTEYNLPDTLVVEGNAFQSCYNLTSISLPNAKVVDFTAFANCGNLSYISLPNLVYATNFSQLPVNIVDVNLSEVSTVIDLTYSMSNYPLVTVPLSLYHAYSCFGSYISPYHNGKNTGYKIITKRCVNPRNSLYNTTSTTRILDTNTCVDNDVTVNVLYFSFSNNIESYYRNAWTSIDKQYRSPYRAITIIDYGTLIKTISAYAFESDSYITTISLPNVTSIGEWAFNSCSSLTSVNFSNLTQIDKGAFNECCNLISVSFPKLSNIGEWAFHNCSSLTSISLPKAEYIDSGAFVDCTNLKAIYVPTSMISELTSQYSSLYVGI